ncbi:MAG: aldehyde dehydrogenase family protein [Peptococcaceae bacterium]|nr:aldehyde dehydrogenase family protein [Peptococcaceae bacterium]
MSVDAEFVRVHDKFTGRVTAEWPRDDRAALAGKIGRAAAGFPLVRRTTPEERLEIVRRVGVELERERERFIGLLVVEAGQARKFAVWEVERVIGQARHFDQLIDLIRPVELPAASGRNLLLREPYGVVGVITPRNTPLLVPFYTLFSALGGGNAVVLRPSTLAPGPAVRLVELTVAAGCPADAVQLSTADGDTAAREFIENPLVNVFMTYSNSGLGKENVIKMGRYLEGGAAGEGILRRVPGKLTKYVPELAGNDPFIVLAGADLDRAVQAAAWGGFANAGQLCISAKRLLVQAGIAEQFKERLREAAAGLKVGDPHRPDTDIGPLGRPESLARAVVHVKKALAQGGRLVFGGQAADPFFYPTLIEFDRERIKGSPKPDLWREESFAPLRTLVIFDTVEEAVQLAEDSPYGLGAAVFGPEKEALALAGRLTAGRVMINEGPLYGDNHLPVGGVKDSGLYGATHKIQEVTYQKRIHIA